MNKSKLQRIFGWMLVLFSVPVLLGVIWSVGLTKAITSPVLVSDVPRGIVEQAPDLVDVTFLELQKPGTVRDENTKLWIQAISQAEQTPRQLLTEIGAFEWMQTDLAATLEEVGLIMRGDIAARDIKVNIIGLKSAVSNPQLESYILEITGYLPDCTEQETDVWQSQIENIKGQNSATNGNNLSLPACNPGESVVLELYDSFRTQIQNMPDEIVAARDMEAPTQMSIARSIVGLAGTLFAIPAIILLLGVMLVTNQFKTRLRLIGIVVTATAIAAYLLAQFAQQGGLAALTYSPNWITYQEDRAWSAEFQEFIVGRLGVTLAVALAALFTPVAQVSTLVLAAGLVFLGLSLIISQNHITEPVLVYENGLSKKAKSKILATPAKTVKVASKKRGRPRKRK
jgi:hypothetical protein